MTATVHDLTARLAPASETTTSTAPDPDPEWTDEQLRIWWLGYTAGYADRDHYYEQQDRQLMESVQRYLDKQAGGPRLEVVS